MLKYCSSCLLVLVLAGSLQAQDLRIRGLRIGYDVADLAYFFLDDHRSELEFSLDTELKKNIYAAAEFGTGNFSLTGETYDYASNGWFMRLGADRNFLKLRTSQYEMVFAGIRYGYSNMTHSAGNISISDPVWGDYTGGAIPPHTLNAHWIEIDGGIRGEIFKNFFIGWTMRYQRMIATSALETMDPVVIPGFGVYSGAKTRIGFTYSVSYRIPLYKVDYSKKKEDTKNTKEKETAKAKP